MSKEKVEVPPEKRCIWRPVNSDDLFTPIICSKCATIIQINPDYGIIDDFIQEKRFHTCPSHETDSPENQDNQKKENEQNNKKLKLMSAYGAAPINFIDRVGYITVENFKKLMDDTQCGDITVKTLNGIDYIDILHAMRRIDLGIIVPYN